MDEPTFRPEIALKLPAAGFWGKSVVCNELFCLIWQKVMFIGLQFYLRNNLLLFS